MKNKNKIKQKLINNNLKNLIKIGIFKIGYKNKNMLKKVNEIILYYHALIAFHSYVIIVKKILKIINNIEL